jgi:hypothetical protein
VSHLKILKNHFYKSFIFFTSCCPQFQGPKLIAGCVALTSQILLILLVIAGNNKLGRWDGVWCSCDVLWKVVKCLKS